MKIKLFEHTPRMSVSEFAEKNVTMLEGASKGQKFSYASRPYFRDPSDAMGDNLRNCRVVIMSPTQLGKTTAFLNYLYYIITYDPENTLIILDSNKTADKLSKVRIRPFLRTQVKLESLQKGLRVDYDKSASTNNISLCSGKNILIGSARSASDLCSFTCKYLLCDETSRYPACLGAEGDPITLALQRQETYLRAMAVLTSTPTTEDCTINQHYLIGTQERWCALCHCGCFMPVHYRDIDFTDPDRPTYACPQCGEVYTENQVQYDCPHLYAPPANKTPFTDGLGRICRSFHITGTLVPERYSWKYLREKELAARETGRGGYMSFVNTSLGEIYVPALDESLNVDKMLTSRRYFTKDALPKWVDYIACGVDVQDDRFEMVFIGSDETRNHVCFIEYKVLLGDMNAAPIWAELLEYLSAFRCTTKDGRHFAVGIVCIDSGGHHTQDVYALCMKSRRLRAVKGLGACGGCQDIIYKVTNAPMKALATTAARVNLTFVNTYFAKDIIREQMLKIQSNAHDSNWVISSDVEAGFDAIFMAQLDAEFREERAGGAYKWTQKKGARNEALDCTVYALTAIDIMRLETANNAAGFKAIAKAIKQEKNQEKSEKSAKKISTKPKESGTIPAQSETSTKKGRKL